MNWPIAAVIIAAIAGFAYAAAENHKSSARVQVVCAERGGTWNPGWGGACIGPTGAKQ